MTCLVVSLFGKLGCKQHYWVAKQWKKGRRLTFSMVVLCSYSMKQIKGDDLASAETKSQVIISMTC